MRSSLKKFWKKTTPGEDGCILWTGANDGRHGYGKFWHKNTRLGAHRFIFICAYGPIPPGLHVDHACRNPRCVNPDHLRLLTPKKNILLSDGPCAINARKTHCKHGHEFTQENTYVFTAFLKGKVRTYRYCRMCHHGHSLNYWRKRRVEKVA